MPNILTDQFRTSSIANLEELANRRAAIEESIRQTEALHRDALAAALAPLEEELRDCSMAIYASERLLGALPPVSPRFQDHSDNSGNDGDRTGSLPSGSDTGTVGE